MSKKAKPLHRPDEPIPEEILARMTKPKVETRFQVTVELKKNFKGHKVGTIIAVGPMLNDRAVCEEIVGAINLGILGGRERYWSNPQIVKTIL